MIKIDLQQAQKFYQQALREQSKAQTPVYLLYLYSKWQSIDLYQSIIKGVLLEKFFLNKSSQVIVAGSLLGYVIILFATVRYLR